MSTLTRVRRWWERLWWKRTSRCTDSEIAVLRGLLPSNDARSEPLLMQAKDAPEIRRCLVNARTCKLTIPYVKSGRYMIDAPETVLSPPLSVVDAQSGRTLTFTVKVLRGGFLNDFMGMTEDAQPWPLKWHLDDSERSRIGGGMSVNWLPPALSEKERRNAFRRLANWCGIAPIEWDSVYDELLDIRIPASESDIASAEARLGIQLPVEYRELVRVADGFSIRYGRPYDVFGTYDTYDVVMQERTFLVVTSLYEDGVVGIEIDGGANESVLLLPTSGRFEVIGNLKTHVHDSLEWLRDLHSQRVADS